ncbi:FecR family protein [Pseudomonas sp. RIT-PI-AD]|uniref:FecR family protein n=1 Tax=Pseudomonas sp. RIT-PI-AD TaxID=3035294 RepID=UPI0021D8EED7|nr:FecR family protein [Pseudomonas sp. RIT-PI-AD]
MNTSSPAPAENDALVEEAARWCMRIHAEDCSAQEREAFRCWLATSPEHAREYLAMLEIWEISAFLEPGLTAEPAATAESRIDAPRASGSPRRAWHSYGLAAAIALLALPAAAYLGWNMGWLPDDYRRYQADISQREVVLPDGSRVDLNLDTRLSFSNYKDRRNVALQEGEAFFTVSHDPAHPFVVEAGSGSITVTGTRFNVWTYRDDVVVTVTEGSVKVNSDRSQGQSSGLTAGMQASYGRADVQPHIDSANAQALAWREGKLILDDLSLAEALPLINRYRRHPVVLADTSIGRIRVGGIYSIHNIEGLIATLPKVLPVKLAQLDDGSTLLSRR